MRSERLGARESIARGGDESASRDGQRGPDESDDQSTDPESVRRRLRRRTERIRRREVAEAVSALEARDGLTDEQRETVCRLGSTLARRVTTPPESALERSDPATGRAVARLFDLADDEA
ncbi:glutamyl-tRNA reductase [Halorubrum sp. AD140]|uniref:glutamyl-tRNA reductase n=1 Tax=Halorubrum sp. AD140 TaxID=3050073 RepID=UPI002ACC8509|nr:glutamyl-tRNA reductase [Halorubrum sp. AD140]MDZ5809753.1 glutamyl-tRNA reductase [Halorubrum sp. AD140]